MRLHGLILSLTFPGFAWAQEARPVPLHLVAPPAWSQLRAPDLHLPPQAALDLSPLQLEVQRERGLKKWEWTLRLAVDLLNGSRPR